MSPAAPPSPVQRARRLEATTVAWNAVEAGVAVVSGLFASSVALTGFGLDSAIEVVSACIVLSRLRTTLGGRGANEERERRSLRVLAATFIALAAYLTVDGIHSLVLASRPDTSPAGIAVSAAALVVMPALAYAKQTTGRRIDGPLGALVLADAAETRLCALLAATTLGGLLAYSVAGLWWADPAAGFIVVGFAVREGWEAWHSELCSD